MQTSMRRLTAVVLVLAMVGAVLLLGNGRAYAAEWAEAVDVRGVVTLVGVDGQVVDLTPGMRLSGGETVRTDWDGYARFQLSGGSILDVFEDSEVVINEVLGEEESGFSLSLFFGRLSMDVENLTSRDMVVAPTMVIGIRGTTFSVGVAEDGATVVSVEEGVVSVSEGDGWTDEPMEISPGNEAVSMGMDQAVTSRPISLGNEEAWKQFREKRFETLLTRLPALVEKAEPRLDWGLGMMQATAQAVITRCGQLEAAMASMQPGDLVRPLRGREARRHIVAIVVGLGALRVQTMRLIGAFRRLGRLDQVLSRLPEATGKSLEATQAAIQRIMARQDEIKAMVGDLREDVLSAVEPIRPVLAEARDALQQWRGNAPWQGNPLGN